MRKKMLLVAGVLFAGFVWAGIQLAASSTGVKTDGIVIAAEATEEGDKCLNEVTGQMEQCKCYCRGASWSPGSTACLGGYKYVCTARTGSGACGWDPMRSGANHMRCDGGEHCR